MSIQGVQPKLSARLRVKDCVFEVVDKGGHYILKPQNSLFAEIPENEDLTMRLAKPAGIETPLHGMIYCKDASLTYFIKRFDRTGKSKKVPLEDFAQIAGKSRDTKYDFSMEKLIPILEHERSILGIDQATKKGSVLLAWIIHKPGFYVQNRKTEF